MSEMECRESVGEVGRVYAYGTARQAKAKRDMEFG